MYIYKIFSFNFIKYLSNSSKNKHNLIQFLYVK